MYVKSFQSYTNKVFFSNQLPNYIPSVLKLKVFLTRSYVHEINHTRRLRVNKSPVY